jgi:hypothetical protein
MRVESEFDERLGDQKLDERLGRAIDTGLDEHDRRLVQVPSDC